MFQEKPERLQSAGGNNKVKFFFQKIVLNLSCGKFNREKYEISKVVNKIEMYDHGFY